MYIENTSLCVAAVPVTFIYTDQTNYKGEKVSQLPVLCLYPHIQFIKCVLGQTTGGVSPYVKFCEKASVADKFAATDKWRANVIKNRTEVFLNMNHMFSLNIDFFKQNAPRLIWNDKKNYFNLDSGKHRATFLVAKGENYIYGKMTKSDYDIWKTYMLSVRTTDMIDDDCSFRILRAASFEMSALEWAKRGMSFLQGLKILIVLDSKLKHVHSFFRKSGTDVYSSECHACFFDYAIIDSKMINRNNIKAKNIFALENAVCENTLFTYIYRDDFIAFNFYKQEN